MRKIVFPQESNLQPLDYRSTALPLIITIRIPLIIIILYHLLLLLLHLLLQYARLLVYRVQVTVLG